MPPKADAERSIGRQIEPRLLIQVARTKWSQIGTQQVGDARRLAIGAPISHEDEALSRETGTNGGLSRGVLQRRRAPSHQSQPVCHQGWLERAACPSSAGQAFLRYA